MILLILVAAVGWTVALPAAAWAAAQPPEARFAHTLAFVIYEFGRVICHQRPERSFHLFAEQLPVCARCTGLYLGGAVAAVLYVAVRSSGSASMPEPARVRMLLLLAALPMVVSLVYEWTSGVVPSNALRAITGVLFGGLVAVVVLEGVAARPPRK
jgi:uncharacterized membrane protein